MKIRLTWFNTYLLLLIVAMTLGCETTGDKKEKKPDKQASTIRFHLEVNPDSTGHNAGVSIYRNKPMMVTINNEPFLSEADLEKAEVVDVMGGYAIRIQFNKHGTWVLDSTTTGNKGRHIAIFSQFGDARWLAAPLITHRISNGTFVFTPDATLEETQRIVRGLNNVAKEIAKDSMVSL